MGRRYREALAASEPQKGNDWAFNPPETVLVGMKAWQAWFKRAHNMWVVDWRSSKTRETFMQYVARLYTEEVGWHLFGETGNPTTSTFYEINEADLTEPCILLRISNKSGPDLTTSHENVIRIISDPAGLGDKPFTRQSSKAFSVLGGAPEWPPSTSCVSKCLLKNKEPCNMRYMIFDPDYASLKTTYHGKPLHLAKGADLRNVHRRKSLRISLGIEK